MQQEDWLSRLVQPLGIHGQLFHVGKHCGNWLLEHDVPQDPSFHLVTEGECYLVWPDGEKILLKQGDLLFFARDRRHQLQPVVAANQAAQEVPLQASLPGVGLICGYFHFCQGYLPGWFRLLPPLLHLPAHLEASSPLGHLLRLLEAEASHQELAASRILEVLAEPLLIYLLRAALQQGAVNRQALENSVPAYIDTALALMHETPQKDWGVTALAREVGVARSLLASQFHETLGKTPGDYLRHLRMHRARQELAQGKSVLEVAMDVGYRSESAFRKAFKDFWQDAPGQVKRTHSAK
ncbi:Helix-turn-helix domain-containing protein [Marinospirillum celere]|uniref:Helix-turn-helix domain-containing protein n=1 Tax=Marinospirillum celere TaxID=1122252 RepID=A0A1I1DVU7_9GAMM|nr:AraC family transcriptional regulator [Marinospirillum celere]SFB78532.1 Helix-turn-helix domain-containing protein [Marinospirillum celere]